VQDEFSGSLSQVAKANKMKEPMYYVALASEQPLPEKHGLYFHGDDLAEKKESMIRSVYENTWSYKIGRLITSPARMLRRLFKNNKG
jgi:hypothetical protein